MIHPGDMIPLGEAWIILGEDPKEIITKLMSEPDVGARVKAAEKALATAERLARMLMGIHHPDRNPGDPEAARRFNRVDRALQSVKYHTAELVKKAAAGNQTPPDDKVRIILK